jgi:hypothetical protein
VRCLSARSIAFLASLAATSLAPAAAPGPTLPPGMTSKIVESIERGLAYLLRVQQPDGSFPVRWEGKGYPVAMTSLAGIALLASGSTPGEGPHAAAIRKAMIFLLERGEAHTDGLMAGPQEMRCTHGHGFAMLFLAQCYGMEPNPEYEDRIRKVLDRAVALLARGQSPRGGWLYSPVGGGDEGSTTACVLQGLRACRNVGIKVPTTTIDRAVGYLRYCQNPDGGIAYSSAHRGASRPPLAAAGLACFYAAGVYDRRTGGDSPESAMVEKLWRYVQVATKDPESVKGHYYYHHFYMAQASYQRGGTDWDAYYKKTSAELLRMQAPDGSWSGDDVGPTYGTAMASIVLQIPYGYLTICER